MRMIEVIEGLEVDEDVKRRLLKAWRAYVPRCLRCKWKVGFWCGHEMHEIYDGDYGWECDGFVERGSE